MTVDEAREALEALADDGLMERLPDGSYKPTELGRFVAITGEMPPK